MSLKERIQRRKGVTVTVIGLGYVGLPLAVSLAEKGFRVIGADKADSRIGPLSQGKSTVEGISDHRVKRMIDTGKLVPVHILYSKTQKPQRRDEDFPDPDRDVVAQLKGSDVFVVCVQTPLRKGKGWEPELKWVRSARKLIDAVCELESEGNLLPLERLIVLESTTYPGTTQQTFKSVLDKYAAADRNWYLAYSPERTDPGPHAHSLIGSGKDKGKSPIRRIVAGLNPDSLEVAVELYSKVFVRAEPISTLATAEMIKLVENTFRFISIAFANEIGLICKALNLNVWEVIDGAKTKGFGLDLCYPGLIGGHCIPIDPHYLGSVARREGIASSFIDDAEIIHQTTKREARDLIQRLLNQQNKGFSGSRILFLGAAYKKNLSDTRESPSVELMKDLFSRGASVSYWDPHLDPVTALKPLMLFFSFAEKQALPHNQLKQLDSETVKGETTFYLRLTALRGNWKKVRKQILSIGFDCVVISTDHDCFAEAYEDLMLGRNAPPIVDLKNAIPNWLKENSRLSQVKITSISRLMGTREKYMLISVH